MDNNKLAMKRKQEAETEEETIWHRDNNNTLMRRTRHAIKEHCDNMKDVISRSKKEEIKFLHKTKDFKNPHIHRAIVCIICDNPQANKGTDFIAQEKTQC